MRRTNRVTAIVSVRHATRFFLFARKFLLIAGSDSIARTETQPGRAPSESNRVKKPRRRVCRSRKRVSLLPFLSFFPLPSFTSHLFSFFFRSRRMYFRSGCTREKRPMESQFVASLPRSSRADHTSFATKRQKKKERGKIIEKRLARGGEVRARNTPMREIHYR